MTHFRIAARRLSKEPAFLTIVALTLALGVGANTAIFGLVNELLLRPLPIARPESLMGIVLVDRTGDFAQQNIPYPIFRDYQDLNPVIAPLAAYAAIFAPVEVRGESKFAAIQLASGDFFSVLGIAPGQGRLLLPDDDRAASPGSVAVLSHYGWQKWFDGDPRIIGKTLTLRPAYSDPVTCTIVGVAPPEFTGLDQQKPLLWLPAIQERHFIRATSVNFRMVGRLRPGVDRRRACGALDVTAAATAARYGGKPIPGYPDEGVFRSDLRTELRQAALGTWGVFRSQALLRRARLLAFGVSGLILMIACANLTNLMLARADRRRKETAVRLSLGSTRGRLLRLYLAETTLLALIGGVAGLVLAHWMNRALVAIKPEDTALIVPVTTDSRSVIFAFVMAVASGIAIGWLPAWRTAREDPGVVLKGKAGGLIGGRWLLRDWLATGQIGLCMVLLMASGLLLRSLGLLLAANPGFNTHELVLAEHWRVEGVVSDSQLKSLTEAPIPYVFLRQEEASNAAVTMIVRTQGDPTRVLPDLRRELLAAQPDLDSASLMTIQQVIGRTLRGERFGLVLICAFAASATSLALLGIYGVVSYQAAQRGRDIAIRIALGARRRDIRRWIMRHGVRLTMLGLAMGTLASWGATRLITGFLFGVAPMDPVTWAGVTLLLSLAAGLACWVPTRRASRLDPNLALRSE